MARQRSPTARSCEADGLTIVEAIARYWRHVQGPLRQEWPADRRAGRHSRALRFVKHIYGDTAADGVLADCTQGGSRQMIDAGLARSSINQHVDRIRRMFKLGCCGAA